MWKSRCTYETENEWTSSAGVVAKVWHRLRIYLHVDWAKLTDKVRAGRIDVDRAKRNFIRDFGTDIAVDRFDDDRLLVPTFPPTPFTAIRNLKKIVYLLNMCVDLRN